MRLWRRSPNKHLLPATGQHQAYYSFWTNRVLSRDFHLRQRLESYEWELWAVRALRLTLDEMRHKCPLGDGAEVPGCPLPCFFCRSLPQINEALFGPTSLKGIVVNCISESSWLPSQLGLGNLDRDWLASYAFTVCQPLGEGKENTQPNCQWTIHAKRRWDHSSEGCASDHMVKGRQKVLCLSPCHCMDWTIGVNQERRPQWPWLTTGKYTISAHPLIASPGKAGTVAISTLLEFIFMGSFRLLSRIIVLLGLEVWEGRRCTFLFINSLNTCFKLKPTPHVDSHRNNIKANHLPAFCYQCQSDLNLLYLLTWGHHSGNT